MGQAAAATKKVLVADDDPSLRHALGKLLTSAGYSVSIAKDGREALDRLNKQDFDLLLLDVWMPRMNGLEVLGELRERMPRPKVVIMTSDQTPDTLLQVMRDQAYDYISKPFPPKDAVDLARRVLTSGMPVDSIQVISARPHWVELSVPCHKEVADRIQGFLTRLKSDLPENVRESVGAAFRELLLNAIEWGGKNDPNRRVRISYVRARKMLMYRIADPGEGFRFEDLLHAAIHNPPEAPAQHLQVRDEKGLRAGGFGILMTKALVDELLYNESQNEVILIKYLE
jgi:two-component system, OmpR family, response regulator